MVAESFRPGLAGLFDSKEHLLRATAYPTQSASVMGSLEGKDRNDENPRLQKACVPQETCTVAMGQEKEMSRQPTAAHRLNWTAWETLSDPDTKAAAGSYKSFLGFSYETLRVLLPLDSSC